MFKANAVEVWLGDWVHWCMIWFSNNHWVMTKKRNFSVLLAVKTSNSIKQEVIECNETPLPLALSIWYDSS